jgi:uncharacterized protein
MMQQQAILREVAHRVFAKELTAATVELRGEDERAPNFVLSPLGAKMNRVFLVGVLVEAEDMGQDGREMWRGRISDPTGVVTIYAGEFQPEAMQVLSRLETPCFVAVSGKVRTYEPEPGQLFISVRPETITKVDEATRDQSIIAAAEHTHARLRAMEAVRSGEASSPEDLLNHGIPGVIAEGAFLAKEKYAETDLAAYRGMLLDTLALVQEGRAIPVHEAVGGSDNVATTSGSPATTTTDEDEELMKLVISIVEDLLKENEDGAPWDDILEAAQKQNHTEDAVEEAINMLIDRGVLYEPILSKLKIA